VSKKAYDLGWMSTYNVYERCFALNNPMMHSERLELQVLADEVISKWIAEYKEVGLYKIEQNKIVSLLRVFGPKGGSYSRARL
jgi:hypothetical protein